MLRRTLPKTQQLHEPHTHSKHRIRIGRLHVGRFRFLLVAIVLTFILRPFMEPYERIGYLTDIFLTLVLLSGILGLTDRRRSFLGAIFMAFSVFALQAASLLVDVQAVDIMKKAFYGLFLGYLLVVIMSHVFREEEVTEDLIIGAVCTYLLIGMTWAFVLYFLELAEPGSFSVAISSPHYIGPFFYYSFVTLATLGYGDIVPLTSPARSLAVLEAIMGQLYLAITIARLVTVHSSQRRLEKDRAKRLLDRDR